MAGSFCVDLRWHDAPGGVRNEKRDRVVDSVASQASPAACPEAGTEGVSIVFCVRLLPTTYRLQVLRTCVLLLKMLKTRIGLCTRCGLARIHRVFRAAGYGARRGEGLRWAVCRQSECFLRIAAWTRGHDRWGRLTPRGRHYMIRVDGATERAPPQQSARGDYNAIL